MELSKQQLSDQLARAKGKISRLEDEDARQKERIQTLNAKVVRMTSTQASNDQLESELSDLRLGHKEAQEEFKSLRERQVFMMTLAVF